MSSNKLLCYCLTLSNYETVIRFYTLLILLSAQHICSSGQTHMRQQKKSKLKMQKIVFEKKPSHISDAKKMWSKNFMFYWFSGLWLWHAFYTENILAVKRSLKSIQTVGVSHEISMTQKKNEFTSFVIFVWFEWNILNIYQ